MLSNPIKQMFDYDGKTVNVIGKVRVKIYHELFKYLDDLQESHDLQTTKDYFSAQDMF